MSNETNPKFAQQLIGYGASLYLQKPISLHDLKYLWQHAFRWPRVAAAKTYTYLRGTGLSTINDPEGKNKEVIPPDRGKDDRQKRAVDMGEGGLKFGHVASMSKTSYEEKSRNGNRIASSLNRLSGSRTRKARLVWCKELHHKFAAAITALGDEKARPKSILKMMKEPNLTHRQIASHLQKHKAQMHRTPRSSPSNLASNTTASTSIYDKPGFFCLPQTPEVTLQPTGSAICFNRNNQQWHQKLNHSLGFDPMSSMNGTLQLPPSMPASTGIMGNQFQNNMWSQTLVDKSGTEVENGAATQSEKWTPEQSAHLVDLLKVLDDDADDCMDPAIEPLPAEVDQVCQWLKEAMLGND
ncbi:two-component response regulator ARR11-like [Hibiscus syriacus]|nr:two-component response regulator ARR11-like [Hibiscus syriacus]